MCNFCGTLAANPFWSDMTFDQQPQPNNPLQSHVGAVGKNNLYVICVIFTNLPYFWPSKFLKGKH